MTDQQIEQALTVAESVGSEMSWWLKKHVDGLRAKQRQGVPIFKCEVDDMLRQYRSDMRILV